jgi:hypothetical protein
MAMHNGKNGVPGPNQNNQQADPIDHMYVRVDGTMNPIRYGTHTSELSTTNTMPKMMAVTGSFKLVHIHTNGLQIHFQIFCQIFFIMVTPVQLSSNVWYCGMTVHPKASTSSVVFLHLGTYQTYDGKSGLLVTWNHTLLPLPITVCTKNYKLSNFVFVHKMSYAVYVGSWQLPQCHSNSPSHSHHRFLSRWWLFAAWKGYSHPLAEEFERPCRRCGCAAKRGHGSLGDHSAKLLQNLCNPFLNFSPNCHMLFM